MIQTLLLTVLLIVAFGLLSTAVGSRWPLALLMAVLLGSGVARLDWRRDVLHPYGRIRVRHVAIAVLTLTLPLASFVLTASVPGLNWSLLSLVGQEEGNAAAVGLDFGPLIAIPYALLMLAVFPSLALVEEYWFRRGTRGWLDAVPRSLLFGLAHMLVGVPLGVALFGLSAVGLVFSAIYLRAARSVAPTSAPGSIFATDRVGSLPAMERRGIEASALQHLTYNVVALLLALTAVILLELGTFLGIE